MVTIEDAGRPLTEFDIIQIEQRVHCRLPESYRRFLLSNNGGRPAPYMQIVDIEHIPGGGTDVSEFFAVDDPVESSTIEWNLSNFEGRISERMLPIAMDSGGNLFCISLSERDFGSVIYCDFEPGFGYHVSESAIYYPVAPDFDSFLEKMRSLEGN
jgi:hypothetical protein